MPSHNQLRAMDEIDEYLNPLRERGAVEYKQAGLWTELEPQVKREALGFANRRDGGAIVIGVAEGSDKAFSIKGLTEEQLSSYPIRQLDQSISHCGYPNIRCNSSLQVFDSKKLILIRIDPFDGHVVVCTKSCHPNQNGPQEHFIYYRCDRLVETRKADANDVREIVERAAEIKLQQRFQWLIEAGILIPGRISQPLPESDQGQYDEELGEFGR